MNWETAKAAAKKNPGVTFGFTTPKSGNSVEGVVYFCPKRKRLIDKITNDGKIWY